MTTDRRFFESKIVISSLAIQWIVCVCTSVILNVADELNRLYSMEHKSNIACVYQKRKKISMYVESLINVSRSNNFAILHDYR